MLSLVDRLRRFFSTSPPDTPPPGGMTFEQRAALIGALYDLKTRGRRRLDEWRVELQRALSLAKCTRPLADALKEGSKEDEDDEEKRLGDIARIGLRLAEIHPIAAFGGDVRHLVAETVENALAKSQPARLARWALPSLAILFSGGLLWGLIKVQGFENSAGKRKRRFRRSAMMWLG